MADILELIEEEGQSIIITPPEILQDRDAWFERACAIYPDARLEMDEAGNIIVTARTSEDSSYRSGEAYAQLRDWARKDGTGRAFDAAALFNLPSGAKRSPDASWVPRETLRREGKNTRTVTKTRHVPTFLIEVMSPSDRLAEQKQKCRKWIEAGVQEVILLHPEKKAAYIFLPEEEAVEIPNAIEVRSRVLAGFIIDCAPIWEEL